MNTIKNIKLSNNKFVVEMEKTSLNLKCSEQEDKYIIDISDMNLISATKTAIFQTKRKSQQDKNIQACRFEQTARK